MEKAPSALRTPVGWRTSVLGELPPAALLLIFFFLLSLGEQSVSAKHLSQRSIVRLLPASRPRNTSNAAVLSSLPHGVFKQWLGN